MTKMKRYVRSINFSCKKHKEFEIFCSDCWNGLFDYFLERGEIEYYRKLASFISLIDKDSFEWKPYMYVGSVDNHTGRHSMGWDIDVYEKRKSIHDDYVKKHGTYKYKGE